MNYLIKYNKYKKKYLNLKQIAGSLPQLIEDTIITALNIDFINPVELDKPLFFDAKYYKYCWLYKNENEKLTYLGLNDEYGYDSLTNSNINNPLPSSYKPTILIIIYNIQYKDTETYKEITSNEQCIILKYYNDKSEYKMHLTFLNSNDRCTYVNPDDSSMKPLVGAFNIIYTIMKKLNIPLYIEDDALSHKIEIEESESEIQSQAELFDMDIETYKNIIYQKKTFSYKIRNYRILMNNEPLSIYIKFGAEYINIGTNIYNTFISYFNQYKILVNNTYPTKDEAQIILDILNDKFSKETRDNILEKYHLDDEFLKLLFDSARDALRDLIIKPEKFQSGYLITVLP